MKTFKYASDGEISNNKSASTIHDLLGIKREVNLPYESVGDLEFALKTMNIIEMQALAMKLQVKPISDRPRLTRALVDQYVRLHKSYGCALKRGDENAKPFDPSQY